MSCQSGNCGGGCNQCHGCCEEQYKSNCYPILDVNCLPTLSRTTSHYIYRTPDDKLWYASSRCNAYLELTCDKEAEQNQLNTILDLLNKYNELTKKVEELEVLVKPKEEEPVEAEQN